jgi:hypothetical protein
MNSFGLLVSDLFTPFGFTSGTIAKCGIIFFSSGITGTVVFAILADKTRKLKMILGALPVGIIIALCLLVLFIRD